MEKTEFNTMIKLLEELLIDTELSIYNEEFFNEMKLTPLEAYKLGKKNQAQKTLMRLNAEFGG